MKYNRYTIFSFSLFFFVCSLFVTSSVSFGGNDPSIKGELRKTIHTSMQTFIDRNTVDGVYSIYDPFDGKLRQLTLVELHEGIVNFPKWSILVFQIIPKINSPWFLDTILFSQVSTHHPRTF